MANEDAMSRKRHAISMASAAASSKSKRFRRSSMEIHEDAQALDRNFRRNAETSISISESAPILQENNNSIFHIVEQLRAEVSDLRCQQAVDRAHFDTTLNSHDEELKDLWNTLDGLLQGQLSAQEATMRSESEGSTVKSEDDDRSVGLYHATPQPRVMPRARTDSQSSGPDHAAFEEDMNLPAIEEVPIKLYDDMRIPELIGNLPPIPSLRLPEQPSEVFTFEFLKKVFGGRAVSSGWWVIPPKTRERRLFPQLKSFRTLNSDYDPLLPRRLGEHGVQLSCILAEVDDEHLTFPLFIRRGQGGYKYYGTYTEPRYSDRLGGDEMRQVPEYVKKHWASQIGSIPRDDKIPKHNETIRAAWPQVPVGWLTENNKKLIPYQERYHDDHEENPVTRPITAEEADEIGEDEILKAFETADTDTAPSMRFYYEYLQCVGYDYDFYTKLVSKKLELEA